MLVLQLLIMWEDIESQRLLRDLLLDNTSHSFVALARDWTAIIIIIFLSPKNFMVICSKLIGLIVRGGAKLLRNVLAVDKIP